MLEDCLRINEEISFLPIYKNKWGNNILKECIGNPMRSSKVLVPLKKILTLEHKTDLLPKFRPPGRLNSRAVTDKIQFRKEFKSPWTPHKMKYQHLKIYKYENIKGWEESLECLNSHRTISLPFPLSVLNPYKFILSDYQFMFESFFKDYFIK